MCVPGSGLRTATSSQAGSVKKELGEVEAQASQRVVGVRL